MNKSRWKNLLKWMLKIVFSLLALYLVFRKIDLIQLTALLPKLSGSWLIPAIVLFNLSKLLSAIRLNMLFQSHNINPGHRTNILLYYTGMFYNLFLPGGIGGDGYKVYWLHKHLQAPVKPALAAVIYDRLNGVAILGFIAFLTGSLLELSISKYFVLLAISIIPLFWFFTRLVFPTFRRSFFSGNCFSLGVQLLQVFCLITLLKAMNVSSSFYMIYTFLFLLSSVAAALPISIGGIGARELVFVYGGTQLGIDVPTGVFISMLFFLVTALSSFTGAFIDLKPSKEMKSHEKIIPN